MAEIIQEDIIDIEMERGTVYRSFMNHAIGKGDVNGNRFGFRCIRNGARQIINGSACVGYFLRSDGTTLVINGAVSDDKAYVILPQSCYAVEGNFTLAIKLGNSEIAETLRIIDGTVINTTLLPVTDPGSQVPDLSSLLAVIERAEIAAAKIDAIRVGHELIEGTRYKLIVTKTS